MDADRSELSALANTLDDLASRVVAVADRYRSGARPDIADGLYEAERSLATASRQLERVVRSMR